MKRIENTIRSSTLSKFWTPGSKSFANKGFIWQKSVMMKISRIVSGCFTILLVAGLFGCDKRDLKSASTPPTGALLESASVKGETIARIHWLGMKRLASETNATGFMKIWNLPESERLEKQTLDKMSTAPWRLLFGQSVTNPAGTLLRPLLDDVVQEESYLEVSQTTNQPGEFVFAIHLNQERAALWETNLSAVLESVLGSPAEYLRPGAASEIRSDERWIIGKRNVPESFRLIRVDDWTLISFEQANNAQGIPSNGSLTANNSVSALIPSLKDIINRIKRNGIPYAASPTNFWVQADVNLPRVAGAFSWNWELPTNFPQINLTAIGDGENVQARGDLKFESPLNLNLQPWIMPTNLVHNSLTEFMAVRGIASLLCQTPVWKKITKNRGATPNQFFMWATEGFPMTTYFAMPTADASNLVAQISDFTLRNTREFCASNDLFGFDRALDSNGLRWTGLPYLTPYLRVEEVSEHPFMLAGFLSGPEKASGTLPDDVNLMLGRTNLLYYDWETTGPRLDAWLFIGQFWRAVSQRPQLAADSAGVKWLKANSPRTGTSFTMVDVEGSNRLAIGRSSLLGLSAIEMHLLVDWLESPSFPVGFYTLLSTNVHLKL